MSFRPSKERVLIKPSPVENVSEGGVIIPDAVQGKPERGKVIAVGADKCEPDAEMFPAVGDSVLFDKNAAIKIHVDDQDLLIVRDSDIIGVL